MGVPKEIVTAPAHSVEVRLVRIERGVSGTWTAYFDLRGEIQVGDGRVIPLVSVVPVRASRQTGRRPRAKT